MKGPFKCILWCIIFNIDIALKNKPFFNENQNLDLQKKSFAVYIKRNHTFFILTLKYKDLNIYLLRDVAGFLKITL